MKVRKINLFEIILLVVGVFVGVIGFFVINYFLGTDNPIGWEFLTVVFLWLMLIVSLILAATMEDVKEELGIIIKEHIEETKILRKINDDQLQELRLLRKDLTKKR